MPDQPARPAAPPGKRVARRNRVRHGLYTDVAVAAGTEAPGDWLDYHEALLADLKPRGALERSLASRAAALLWRLRRVTVAEADLLDRVEARQRAIHARHPDATAEDVAGLPFFHKVVERATRSSVDAKAMWEFMRIEAHLNRQLMHTLHELEVTRDRRQGKSHPLARVDVHGLPGT